MAVIPTIQQKTSRTDSERLTWLSQSWLEPRLVVVTALALGLSILGSHLEWPAEIILILNILAYLSGGVFGAKTAIESLMRRRIDVDMLMVLAALGAATIDQWHEGAILLFLFSLSNVLQDYAIGRSRQAIKSLFKLYPQEATVRRGEQTLVIPLKEIALSDEVLIKPGERIPVDGVVLDGRSAVDESPITGESMPVDKGPGALVFAGTLNKQGTLDVRPTKSATDTTLARIIRMVEEAQDSKAPTERFLDKFEQVYALLILVGVALFIVIPPMLGLVDFQSNFYRAMVLMTVASPCALIISVPAAFISAIASAARGGVLFKGGAHIEALAAVKAIAFDKTGTLTTGQPRLTRILAHGGLSKEELLRLVASVESRSEHPLARAILEAANERQLELIEPKSFQALAGKGIEAELDGQQVCVGNLRYLSEIAPLPPALQDEARGLQEEGQTVIGMLRQRGDACEWLGLLAIADQVRPEAAAVVRDLQAQGIAVAMLTGDNDRVAHNIAAQLGIQRVYANLMPEDKVTALKSLIADYGEVAMVGDGVNDAPALATASVGIAMGVAGTDVAMETADVVLMADRLERIDSVIALARKARRVVWQNIIFSLAVIVMLVAGAFLIDLPLPLGVLGHEGSTVIVVLNGLISLLLIPEIQRRRAANA